LSANTDAAWRALDALVMADLIAAAQPAFVHLNMAGNDLPRWGTAAYGAGPNQRRREPEEKSLRTSGSPGTRRRARRGRARPAGAAAVAGSCAGLGEDGVGGGDWSPPRPIHSMGKLGEARWSRWRAQRGAGVAGMAATSVGRG
jgi:hypothetical protein